MTRAGELLPQFLLDRNALTRRQTEADRVIAAALAGHLVHDYRGADDPPGSAPNRPWRLDPVPLVLDAEVFERLAAGVRGRMTAMEALLADLYGPRRAVREGWVPAEALSSSDRYRLAAVGAPPPPRWLTTYAVDVIAQADGTWRVVQDLADTPTGVGYALLDRSVMARVAAELLGPEGAGDLASISGFPAELRHTLATTTPAASPRIVLFSGGVDEAAYVEHSSLARQLGFHLVEAPDLVVRKGRLWLRTLGGLEPIDVVYRRLADVAVDPIEVSATSTTGVPGLLFSAAAGGVVLANAHGAGVLEDPTLALYWPDAVAGLVGTSLSLPMVDAAVDLAAVPAFRDGQIGTANVVVRLHAVAGPAGVTVMAGGNGRVLNPGDDPRRPTARLAKDVWVVGPARAAPVIVAPPLPQVDLASSVPTRAADAMYWLGRAAERAEAIARTARVVASRRQQDPSLVLYEDGRWARRMAHVLSVARGEPLDAELPDGWPVFVLDRELADATRAVGERLSALLTYAATVGEYLPVTTGRVLGDLAASRREFAGGGAPIDALDEAIADLAAFAGLWNESTVRGPAWRFGDIGRRVERSLVVLGLFDSCLRHVPDTDRLAIASGDIVDRSALDVLLAANESLAAYRRRHRSDVELLATAHLLLLDVDNPRSYAASMRRLAEHVDEVAWSHGRRAVAQMTAILDADDPLGHVEEAFAAVDAFGRLVDDTWFATPVNPMLVQGRPRWSPAEPVHYRVSHRTTYQYARPMSDGYTLAYLLPRPTAYQVVEAADVDVAPRPDERAEHIDVFGNRVLQIGVHRQHDSLSLHAESEVVVAPAMVTAPGEPWEAVAMRVRELRGGDALAVRPFAGRSPYVPLGPHHAELRALAEQAFAPFRPIVDGTRDLCRLIHETFEYDPTFTDVSTPLSIALTARRGVCQDFAHLAAGCLRSLGLAARYVSGYVDTSPPSGRPQFAGADASHAWCSVWVPQQGWIDFDPTNDQLPTDGHVTLAWGRDYGDVAPVRGVVIGPAARQTLSVEVRVARVHARV